MHFDDARKAVHDGMPAEDAARQLVAAMTPEERLGCLDGDGPIWAGLAFYNDGGYHRAPASAAQVDRVGIPGVHFADGPRGCGIGNGTAFPVSMARGAAWDPDLEERIGEVIGRELRAAGANFTGAVCVNVLRHPAWGRAQETYGEDPFHVGELGAAFTRGLQRHVLACVKHFSCNSMENARFQVDVEVDEVALHEVFLPHFRRIVDEGVAAVMTAYNAVNGEWCGQSPTLIGDILRGEWGFEGFTISDFIFGLRDAAASLTAGLDIEMPFRMVRMANLPAALERGDASWDDVDAAASRVVATLLRFDDLLRQEPAPRSVLGAPKHRALAREAAARSVVVLRNEPVAGSPVLPLDPGERLAVVGRLADRVNLGDGGSSDVWDLACHTVADGLRSAFSLVDLDDSGDPTSSAELASTADTALVVVGYTFEDEGEYIGAVDKSLTALFPPADEPEAVKRFAARNAALPPTTSPPHLHERPKGFSVGGDRRSLRLHEHDVALIEAVAAANARTIVVIQAGSAVLVDEWVGDVPGVVQAFYGGSEAGPGLADVLTGAVNPSARLPFSVPRHEDDLPPFDADATSFRYDRWHGWWHLARNETEPAYPFGFGLSYTSFELGDTTVDRVDDGLRIRTAVRNTGGRDGAEVVQVYAQLPDPDRPDRLVAFERVEVGAGEERTVELTMPVERLATRDPDRHTWRPASGSHRIVVARFAGDPDAKRHHVEL